jgi:hypothetical protein
MTVNRPRRHSDEFNRLPSAVMIGQEVAEADEAWTTTAQVLEGHDREGKHGEKEAYGKEHHDAILGYIFDAAQHMPQDPSADIIGQEVQSNGASDITYAAWQAYEATMTPEALEAELVDHLMEAILWASSVESTLKVLITQK